MNYLIIVSVIGVLILVHELGHFIAARRVGIPIARFSIGFGPGIFGFKRGKTEYRLSLIPLGGYVMPEVEEESLFFKIPVRKRIVFAAGGPLANIMLAFIFFGILNWTRTGFSFTGVFLKPVPQTLSFLYDILLMIPLVFSNPGELNGIVGIVVQGGGLVTSVQKALSFSIFLSLNLAVFNMLPVPALDGGTIAMCILEKISPKFLKFRLPFAVAGWVFIIALIVYTTTLDIGRLF